MMKLIKLRHIILLVIVAVALWALWPARNNADTVRLGTDPAHLRNLPPSVKYVLRIHPGAYLPGLMPDNVGKPLSAMTRVAEAFENIYPDTRIEFVGVPSQMREWL